MRSEIKKLEKKWAGRTDVTPEFQRFIDSVQKIRTVKCPKCFKKKYIRPEVVVRYCEGCQIEMVEVEI